MPNNDLMMQQNVLSDLDALERIEKFAGLMATARVTIPAELQNKPGDCLALCLQAQVWGMNPYAVAQKAHVIKGKIGYEAQLVNAVITCHAPIKGRPAFTWSEGWERIIGKFKKVPGKNGGAEYAVPNWADKDEDGLWCEVSATIKGESAPRVLRLDMRQAHPRQSTLWATDPKQQLAYIVMKRWARLHCPDVILGIYTPDELKAMPDSKEKDVTPSETLKGILHGQSVTARTESKPPAARAESDQYIEDKQEPTTQEVIEASANDSVIEDKAESMKQRVRKSMQDKNQTVEPAASEQDIQDRDLFLEMLQNCQNMAQLEEAGNAMAGHIHPEFVKELKNAYKQRRQELSDADQSE